MRRLLSDQYSHACVWSRKGIMLSGYADMCVDKICYILLGNFVFTIVGRSMPGRETVMYIQCGLACSQPVRYIFVCMYICTCLLAPPKQARLRLYFSAAFRTIDFTSINHVFSFLLLHCRSGFGIAGWSRPLLGA
jgi:hypothetical protein